MPAPVRNPIHVNDKVIAIIAAIHKLFEPEKGRLEKLLEKIIQQNQAKTKTQAAGFNYKGSLYAAVKPYQLRGQNVPELHADLHGEADHYIFLTDKMEKDRQLIRQAIPLIATRCHTDSALRDALPEAFVALIPSFDGMERTRPEGYILDTEPLLRKQYDTASEIVNYYVANRILY
jgi:hypothetical protein